MASGDHRRFARCSCANGANGERESDVFTRGGKEVDQDVVSRPVQLREVQATAEALAIARELAQKKLGFATRRSWEDQERTFRRASGTNAALVS